MAISVPIGAIDGFTKGRTSRFAQIGFDNISVWVVADPNVRRVSLVVQNQAAVDVFISLGDNPPSGFGLRLRPNESLALLEDTRGDGVCEWTGVVTLTATAGSGTAVVNEVSLADR